MNIKMTIESQDFSHWTNKPKWIQVDYVLWDDDVVYTYIPRCIHIYDTHQRRREGTMYIVYIYVCIEETTAAENREKQDIAADSKLISRSLPHPPCTIQKVRTNNFWRCVKDPPSAIYSLATLFSTLVLSLIDTTDSRGKQLHTLMCVIVTRSFLDLHQTKTIVDVLYVIISFAFCAGYLEFLLLSLICSYILYRKKKRKIRHLLTKDL